MSQRSVLTSAAVLTIHHPTCVLRVSLTTLHAPVPCPTEMLHPCLGRTAPLRSRTSASSCTQQLGLKCLRGELFKGLAEQLEGLSSWGERTFSGFNH